MKKESKEIADLFLQKAGKYSATELFTDFVKMFSLAIANSLELDRSSEAFKQREEHFNLLYNKQKDVVETFHKAFDRLLSAMETEIYDFLGEIYMAIGQASSLAGQFFTPFHLSVLTAEMGFADEIELPLTLNEPACGSGGLILATAKVLQNKGIDYQRNMKVVAQDLDERCVSMCHLQLSLYGINAIVVRGSTLTDPYTDHTRKIDIFQTPAKAGALI